MTSDRSAENLEKTEILTEFDMKFTSLGLTPLTECHFTKPKKCFIIVVLDSL
jgi:hypothetical protein